MSSKYAQSVVNWLSSKSLRTSSTSEGVVGRGVQPERAKAEGASGDVCDGVKRTTALTKGETVTKSSPLENNMLMIAPQSEWHIQQSWPYVP